MNHADTVKDLSGPHAQDRTVNSRHAFERPGFRMRGDRVVNIGGVRGIQERELLCGFRQRRLRSRGDRALLSEVLNADLASVGFKEHVDRAHTRPGRGPKLPRPRREGLDEFELVALAPRERQIQRIERHLRRARGSRPCGCQP